MNVVLRLFAAGASQERGQPDSRETLLTGIFPVAFFKRRGSKSGHKS